ncbi:MAG: LpqN/LpqT family lipoprotein [Mycobacterium sp.]
MRTVIVASALTALVFVAGCGSSTTTDGTTDGAAVTDHSCTSAAAPLTLIDPQADGEPELHIPQPAGWETSDKLNSPTIRFAMVNTDLASEGFAPNAVVTFETAGGDGAADADQVFDQQRELLESQLGATDVSVESGTQCGFAAQTISYTAPAMNEVPERQSKVLCVLADVDGATFLTTLTISTVDPEDSTYAEDSTTILAGFQINS